MPVPSKQRDQIGQIILLYLNNTNFGGTIKAVYRSKYIAVIVKVGGPSRWGLELRGPKSKRGCATEQIPKWALGAVAPGNFEFEAVWAQTKNKMAGA